MVGRLIGPDDAKAAVAIVSDEFWRERLNKDPRGVGAAIKISGKLRTVIGVLPPGFHPPQTNGGPIVYLPTSLNQSGEDEFKIESAAVIGRLKCLRENYRRYL